jgi:hypothetical protein
MFLIESQIKQYLDGEAAALATFLGDENDRVKFARWKSQVAKQVEVVPYKTLPVAKEVDKALDAGRIKVKQKQCYDNSFWTSFSVGSGINYCEGIASKFIPIDHAWNSYQGKYFDLTDEIALKDHKGFDEHVVLIELSSDEVLQFAQDLDHSGPFALAYFYKNVLKKWNKKIIKSMKMVFD